MDASSNPAVGTEPNAEEIKIVKAIFEANECVSKRQYREAQTMYSAIVETTSHPAAFMNRSLCHIALGQPHLAVNDSLRAYIAAQHVLSEFNPNHETVRHYQQISNYANECHKEIKLKTPWTRASAKMLETTHKSFKLARMTVFSRSGPPKDENPEGDTEALLESPVDNLRLKALFRLTYALAKCGRGPAYAALGILEGVFRLSKEFQTKHGIDRGDHTQLSAVAKMIQDNIMEDAICAKLSASDYAVSLSRFGLMDPKSYGFLEHSIDEYVVKNAIRSVDSNAIVTFTYDSTAGKSTLVANQDAFKGSVLFTECLPFVVCTANTGNVKDLEKRCDTCGAELRIPSAFSDLVKSEEEKLEKDYRAGRGVPTTPRDTQDIFPDDYLTLSPEWSLSNDTERTNVTPPRGRQRSRATIFETSDLQVCRMGNSKVRENFTYCSTECQEMAFSTYHDSICGTHIENYLRTSIIEAEHPKIPSVQFQKLTLLILVRVLSWAHATSTDPLDLPVTQLLLASPRHKPLGEEETVSWSFHNNVLRPIQILQAMDGRTYAPKSAVDARFTDGRVLNTIISLIERYLYVSSERRWEKLYSEEGYLEETIAPRRDSHKDDTDIFFGRLRPLCDLMVVASVPEDANVEVVDLGDGRVICIPFSLNNDDDEEEDNLYVRKDTPLLLRSAEPRRATADEVAIYARKYDDYGIDDVMVDVDHEAEEEEINEDDEEYISEDKMEGGEYEEGVDWETTFRVKEGNEQEPEMNDEDMNEDEEMVMN